jgi:hypothetical protein
MTEKRFNVFDVDGTIFLEDHKEGSYHIGEIGNVDVNCLNDIANRLNELNDENERLKVQLSADIDEGICYICKHQQLIEHKDMRGYYTAICEKGYLQCSKSSVRYCEDFEIKELSE